MSTSQLFILHSPPIPLHSFLFSLIHFFFQSFAFSNPDVFSLCFSSYSSTSILFLHTLLQSFSNLFFSPSTSYSLPRLLSFLFFFPHSQNVYSIFIKELSERILLVWNQSEESCLFIFFSLDFFFLILSQNLKPSSAGIHED